jgi:hypothetical protein
VNGRDDRFVELKGILGQYFVRRGQLEQLVSDRLSHNLSDIDAPNDTLRDTIHKVVFWADNQGILCKLVVAAIEERSGRDELQTWCRRRCPRDDCQDAIGTGRPDTPSDRLTVAQQVLEGPVFFDLDDLRKKVWATLSLEPSRVVAFGVAYEDDMFINSLAKWFDISRCLARAQIKDAVNLDPICPTAEPDRVVSMYRTQLDRGDVLLPVRLGGATAATAQQFLTRVRDGYADLARNRLVLLFTAGTEESFPSEIFVLPAPRFTVEEIAAWAGQLIQYVLRKADQRREFGESMLAWAPRAITNDIVETARLNDSLDVRLVYTKMTTVLMQISEDSLAYLAGL